MKIYVASSWRNPYQSGVVEFLRTLGHDVYDFKNPPQKSAFSWSSINPHWRLWRPKEWREALSHPYALRGFNSDFNGMLRSDCGVFVAPAGPSACMEIGWLAGAGKKTVYLIPEGFTSDNDAAPTNRKDFNTIEPDLMVSLCSHFVIGKDELGTLFKKD